MLARCERVEPACMRASSFANATARCLSSCLTDTPLFNGSVSVPFAPLMVIISGAMVAVTPCGRSTGAFATLLIKLRHDAQDFSALSDGAGLAVGHYAFGRRDDHGAHATQNFRQLFGAAIDAQARLADSLDAVDHGAAVVIFQADGEARLASTIVLQLEIGDIAFVSQYFDDGCLQLRGREAHLGLARGLAVADAGQQIGDGIGHAHRAYLTSSPSRDLESRRDSPLRESSRATARTCGIRRANGP